MDHEYIQEHQIVSLYAMGKLVPADRLAFEDHLVECGQCQDELEVTDSFRGALRQVAAEDLRAVSPVPAPAWLPGLGSFRQAAILAGLILLAGLPSLWLLSLNRQVRQELERTRAAAVDTERRYTAANQLPAAAAPLFTLNLTRGADLGTADPPNAIAVSPLAKSAVLALEWPGATEFQSYRTTLTNAAGQRIWSADQILPPSSDALAINIPTNIIPPGVYRLTLEGSEAGRYSIAARYDFRVKPTQ